MTEELVWEAELDGRYKCKVIRNSLYSGQLIVFDNETKKFLYDEEVRLSFGAAYGPDELDVSEWQTIIERLVDA